MARITFDGLKEYQAKIEELGKRAPGMINQALYDGAKILADAVQNEIDGLHELTPEARQGLHDGLGVARFWNEKGATVTKVGFDGYNSKKTKRWPKGQPNAMIARSVQRGTSWLHANRFATRAARRARQRCIAAMQARFDKGLQEYTK